MLECSVKRAALAVLWASFHFRESGLSVATTIGEAAGLQGRHQWGLILPSSARVSLVTYQTVVAVRYPGLVHAEHGVVSYGRFFTADVNQAGGSLLCGMRLELIWKRLMQCLWSPNTSALSLSLDLRRLTVELSFITAPIWSVCLVIR